MPEDTLDYNPDIVTVSDEDGNEISFEVLDRIEDDDEKRYVALIPAYDDEDPGAILEQSAELIILRVEEDEEGETFLCPIEDDEEFNRIGNIFEERLADYYDIEDEDDE